MSPHNRRRYAVVHNHEAQARHALQPLVRGGHQGGERRAPPHRSAAVPKELIASTSNRRPACCHRVGRDLASGLSNPLVVSQWISTTSVICGILCQRAGATASGVDRPRSRAVSSTVTQARPSRRAIVHDPAAIGAIDQHQQLRPSRGTSVWIAASSAKVPAALDRHRDMGLHATPASATSRAREGFASGR